MAQNYEIVCKKCETSHVWTLDLEKCSQCGTTFSNFDVARQVTEQALARQNPEGKKVPQEEVMH